jgi:hypothetical protein
MFNIILLYVMINIFNCNFISWCNFSSCKTSVQILKIERNIVEFSGNVIGLEKKEKTHFRHATIESRLDTYSHHIRITCTHKFVILV